MSYADLTYNDRNPIKRWLQRRRLHDAIALSPHLAGKSVLDFGGGDGALCKALALQKPHRLICYEPAPNMAEEALANLAAAPDVRLCRDSQTLANDSVDILFCLEVFEHLPEAQTAAAFAEIGRLLTDNGVAIIGVPVETGFPALYKGLFRWLRRPGRFDTRPGHIFQAMLGHPPSPRPVGDIGSNLPYHFEHLGFDQRHFAAQLEQRFQVVARRASPIAWLAAFNPEMYFLVKQSG